MSIAGAALPRAETLSVPGRRFAKPKSCAFTLALGGVRQDSADGGPCRDRWADHGRSAGRGNGRRIGVRAVGLSGSASAERPEDGCCPLSLSCPHHLKCSRLRSNACWSASPALPACISSFRRQLAREIHRCLDLQCTGRCSCLPRWRSRRFVVSLVPQAAPRCTAIVLHSYCQSLPVLPPVHLTGLALVCHCQSAERRRRLGQTDPLQESRAFEL